MPSTGGAIRKPGQRPLPLRPFSGGRRTGRGEGRCVGSGSCRGLIGGIPVVDRSVRVGCPSLLVSLLRGRDAALHVLPQAKARCHRREGRCINQSRNLRPCVPSPEGDGQEEGRGQPGWCQVAELKDTRSGRHPPPTFEPFTSTGDSSTGSRHPGARRGPHAVSAGGRTTSRTPRTASRSTKRTFSPVEKRLRFVLTTPFVIIVRFE